MTTLLCLNENFTLCRCEEASNETEIGTATDRDSGLYGQKGFKYELLLGDQRTNVTLFNVDQSTGQIRVSECPTPGRAPCLSDINDNPPTFDKSMYKIVFNQSIESIA
jgi:hypothetical protein